MTDIPSDVEPVSGAFETLWANSVALRDHAELGRQIKAHYDANYAPRCHHGLTLDACPACPNSSAEPDPRDAEIEELRAELFAEQRMAIQRVLRIIALERQVASMAPVGAVHGAGAVSASDGHAALHAALRRSGGDGVMR